MLVGLKDTCGRKDILRIAHKMELDQMERMDNNAFTKRRFAQKIRTRMKTEEAKYHKFLWEDEDTGKIAAYQMNRPTFGDVCSPFIATYVIQKIAEDHRKTSMWSSTWTVQRQKQKSSP